jgi:hypothetical protein
MGNGQWAMGNGQWAMGNGQWAMGNGQWAMGNGQWAMGNLPTLPLSHSPTPSLFPFPLNSQRPTFNSKLKTQNS